MDQEDACRDSSGGYLSQLLILSKKPLFTKSGLYSCLAFFSFGLMSVFSTAPQIDPSSFVPEDKPADVVAVKKASENSDERCRLQTDVVLFLSLREQKSPAIQTDILCEEKSQISVETIGKTNNYPDETLGNTIQEMVAGYPVEKMVPAIAKYNREVAALIVGIAKKESDWGKHSPRDQNGADCFNYWGYKGAGSRGVAMGHGCFGSPEEAVAAIGDRLTELVAIRQTSKPENMIVWKCGSSCKGHSAESVRKWIADVSLYYHRIAF